MRNILSFAFLLAFLAGCDLYGRVGIDDTLTEGTLPELLLGEWVFPTPPALSSERYVIERTVERDTIQYIGFGDGTTDFKGEILFVSNFSATSGVIIIRYIEGHYPAFPLHNGNSYFGIFYRNLGEHTVQLANSIEPDGLSAPDTATLEEAKRTFTHGRMGRYVNWGIVQPQWRVTQ